LRADLARWEGLVSSALLQVEAVRACARYGSDYAANAESGLGALTLLPLDATILENVSRLEPAALRSLDAIHLATALSVGDDIAVMYVYDERLATAARAAGVQVQAPA
jgi:predicted nucleic acid-binding protein